MRSRLASETGFTLTELVITVSIATLGWTMAVPAYTSWTARTDLKAAIMEVSTGLTYSRMAAMNRNTTVTLSLSLAGGRVQMDTGNVLHTSTMGGGVTAFTGGPISFSSLGLRAGGGVGTQLITMSNSKGVTYSIAVTPGGKVNWCLAATCT